MISFYEELPSTIKIDGEIYNLDLSFSNIFRLTEMLQDKTLNDASKINIAIHILIEEELDITLEEKVIVFDTIYKEFIGGGEQTETNVDIKGNPMPSDDEEGKHFDMIQDIEYIYASFMKEYKIDLLEHKDMHWYKFKALLNGLGDDSKLTKVIQIRTAELPTGKGSEKERSALKKLKRQYALKGVE